MKMSKKSILGIGIAILLVIFAIYLFSKTNKADYAEKDYPQISDEGILRIVTDYNSVGYFVSGDTIAGFNHDLIQLLQTYTPLKIELSLETSLSKSIEDLRKGKYDVVARNIPVTSDLKDSLSFTDVITQNKQVLIQRKKEFNNDIEPIRSHLDLAKKTLYVPYNSPAILRVRNLSSEIGDTIYYVEDKLYGAEQLVLKVAAGEIDYAVCDEKVAKKLSKSLPEIDYSTLVGFTHFEAWIVRKNSPALLDSLNAWIGRVKDTPEYDLIYKKYYE
ncbi:transporter substrate-binding domain-containing protein [Dysgonomonas sp. ZJ709]|uniref:transporter substrate-binding domain-containing protein n=1 Tax=Dysgonomonas sp. ZJ709 TaxID=2709797 RepID=UPI0021079A5D|nr:transporter substrate-binding domain-containing protein [Dysgonomonas sp. ZJ709]